MQSDAKRARLWRVSGLCAPIRLRPAAVNPLVTRQSTSGRSGASASVAIWSSGSALRRESFDPVARASRIPGEGFRPAPHFSFVARAVRWVLGSERTRSLLARPSARGQECCPRVARRLASGRSGEWFALSMSACLLRASWASIGRCQIAGGAEWVVGPVVCSTRLGVRCFAFHPDRVM
jgi:hypothetical protein